MKKHFTIGNSLQKADTKIRLVVFLFLVSVFQVIGQTTVFYDDFNRAAVSPGGSPSMTYTTTIGTGSGQTATIPANDFLNLLNAAVTGNIYVSGVTSSFSSFNSILSSNVGIVEWTFNSRYVRSTAASGLASGNYGYAVVLAGTNASFHNAGNGYAIVYGNSGSPDPIRLVKYTNGLQGTLADVINSTTANISDIRGYASVRVKYIPSSNSWSLYVRDDGTSAWVSVLQTPVPDGSQYGTTVVDNTYTTTGNTITNFGYFWNHAATTGQKSTFDNFKVTVNMPVVWTSGWPKAESPSPTGFTAKVKTNVASTAYYVVLANGSTAPSTAQVKAGQDASGAAATASGSIVCGAGSTEYASAAGGSLASSTTYDVYFVAQDASGNNLQATPVSATITTSASASAPTIQDPTATSITNNSALLGGNITSDGGSAILERGTVWKATTGVTISDNLLAEGGTSSGLFTHSRTSLPAKSPIYYKAYATNAINTTLSAEGSFYTLATEPTAQVTLFTATANSTTSIDLSWTAAAGADGYVILQRQSASASSGIPVDASYYTVGSALGNGTVAAYVSSGATTSQTITGLSAGTVYTFKIYSVNSDGTNAGTYNYFTTSPLTATATTLVPPAVNYVWNQTSTASFTTPTNWTPTRTTPAISDILQFNSGTSVIVTDVPTQTIGQLQISNNTTVELQSSAAVTLTISGGTGVDLDVQRGSALNIAQATNAIVVTVGTGATGSIAGTVAFSNAAHKLTAADANGITFQNGSSFTAGLLFTSNAFGTTGTANSVIFANGSKYYAYAGANPFALTVPASIVVWQAGSTYVLKNTGAPSLGNRTYANFEMDEATGAGFTSSSALTMDNLIVTSGSWSLGIKALHTINGSISIASGATLNLNPATTAGTIALKGDINIVSGGTLNINPSSTTEDVTFSGTSVQNISNSGTLNNATGSSYVIANSTGVNIASNVTIPALTINSGSVLNVNAGKQLTVSTTMSHSGTLNLLSTPESGTASILPPAIITGSGISTVQQYLPYARNWYVSSPVTGAVAPANFTYYQRDEAGSSWTTQPFDAGNTFVAGKGYIALPATAASTILFSGTLNNTNVDVSLTKSGSGFNLIGNPYPCHLGWTYDFTNANATLIESSIWVRTNAGTTNNSNQWSFVTFNATSAESVPSVGNAGIVAPMQAFWVKAKTEGTLTLNSNLTRSHQSSNPLKVSKAKNTNRQRIRLQVSNGLASDETLLYFDANASDVFDAYDSPKMSNNSASIPEIYTQAGTEKLVINGMAQPVYDVEIPLGFTTGQAANFTISKIEMANFEAGTRLLLKDKLNSLSEFDLSQGDTYNFSSEILNSSNNRFSLVLKAPGTATGNKPENSSVLQVFVNAANQITIIANEKSTYSIYNAMGQKVDEGILISNKSTIYKIFSAGVYFVTINVNGQSKIQKVIIR